MSQNSKTAKLFWGDIIACWIPDWLLQAIQNTWNKNTKTEVASRNNVVYQSVLTLRILQWMLTPIQTSPLHNVRRTLLIV